MRLLAVAMVAATGKKAWPLLSNGRIRVADGCSARGRVLIAFGAHTDDKAVQGELTRLVRSAASVTCPPHDVALFVDAARKYKVLNHSTTVRVPFAKLVNNGSAAFRAFVSHQLLMAAVPHYLRHDRTYESAWIVEEDSRFAGGEWAELFAAHNSSADLVAHVRRTNRGTASLMAVSRVSTRLFRAVYAELANLAAGRPTASRKTIHGAFIYGLCQRSKWCKFERIPKARLAVFRAKCPWSIAMFDKLAPLLAPSKGRIFHPVKVHAPMKGRDFKRFNCKKQFDSDKALPDRPTFAGATSKETPSSELQQRRPQPTAAPLVAPTGPATAYDDSATDAAARARPR